MTSMCYDAVSIPLKDLMRRFGCSIHELPETLSLQSYILSFKAVMTQTKQLANISDFVKVTSPRVRPLLLIFILLHV